MAVTFCRETLKQSAGSDRHRSTQWRSICSAMLASHASKDFISPYTNPTAHHISLIRTTRQTYSGCTTSVGSCIGVEPENYTIERWSESSRWCFQKARKDKMRTGVSARGEGQPNYRSASAKNTISNGSEAPCSLQQLYSI